MSFGTISADGPAAQKSHGWNALGWSMLGVLAIAIIATLFSGGSSKSSADNDAELAGILAERACQRSVETQLKAPSTAKFSSVTATGSGTKRTVIGEVDAENSFGASLRNSFTCDVTVVNESATVTSVSVT